MKKVILSIHEPCHEKWEDMEPVERGRFCASCQRTVIDFSQMTDSQLAAYFRKPVASSCGQLHADQLGREIVIPKKTLPWVKYFFQITLPAFLISIKTYSQKTSGQKQVVQTVSQNSGLHKKQKTKSIISFQKIKGRVTDSLGNPVPFATISVDNSIKSTAADELGNFELNASKGDSIIIVSAIGFQSTEYRVNENSFAAIKLNSTVAAMEPVLVTSYVNRRCIVYAGGITSQVVQERSFPSIRQMVDTIFSNISIYPNPVTANSVITIRTNKVEKGNYLVSIFDEKGAVTQITSTSFQRKNELVEMPVGNLASGIYFLHLRNKKTGKQYTKKLVIQ